MTTLRFPNDIPLSGDVLMSIAAALGVPLAQVSVDWDGALPTGDPRGGGWVYERRDDDVFEGGALMAGVVGYPLGTRWPGNAP